MVSLDDLPDEFRRMYQKKGGDDLVVIFDDDQPVTLARTASGKDWILEESNEFPSSDELIEKYENKDNFERMEVESPHWDLSHCLDFISRL